MLERVDARLRLLTAAALFSTGGAAIKAASLTAWQVASFRSAVAALTVWLLVPAARKRWSPRVTLVAAIYALTMVLFVLANRLTTSANTTFLQATAPLYVLLVGPWLLGEKNTRDDVIFMIVVALGMACFFIGTEPAMVTAPDPVRGNILAALSGVTWALTVLGLRWIGLPRRGAAPTDAPADRSGPVVTVVAGNVLAFLFCLPFALPVVDAGPMDFTVIAYLGVAQIGFAYLCLSSAMPQVPALEASTLLLVEPALSPLWAWLVHGETPGAWSWIGGAIIIAAAGFKTWWDAQSVARRDPSQRQGAR
jgi:drug/metabolite transporter (DMT)-like permease